MEQHHVALLHRLPTAVAVAASNLEESVTASSSRGECAARDQQRSNYYGNAKIIHDAVGGDHGMMTRHALNYESARVPFLLPVP